MLTSSSPPAHEARILQDSKVFRDSRWRDGKGLRQRLDPTLSVTRKTLQHPSTGRVGEGREDSLNSVTIVTQEV